MYTKCNLISIPVHLIYVHEGAKPVILITLGKGDVMGKYLTYRNRTDIEAMLKVNTPVKVIAAQIGCCLSCVYKEIKRGQVSVLDTHLREHLVYSADVAQYYHRQAQTSKGRPIKLGNDYSFAHFVEHKIIYERYSPAAALAAARRAGHRTSVCTSTLYSYIDRGYFLRLSNRHLLIKGHRPPKKEAPRGKRHCKFPLIDDRPKHIYKRQEFGHWEMDCVCGKQGTTTALLVLTERMTRYEMIFKIPDKTMASVVSVLNRLERRYRAFGDIFKSITVDNGSEFQDYTGMISSIYGGIRTSVYYCHPYRSSERGSNENCNRLIRRFVPKGSDIGNVSAGRVRHIQRWINSYPRRIFGYRSAGELLPVRL